MAQHRIIVAYIINNRKSARHYTTIDSIKSVLLIHHSRTIVIVSRLNSIASRICSQPGQIKPSNATRQQTLPNEASTSPLDSPKPSNAFLRISLNNQQKLSQHFLRLLFLNQSRFSKSRIPKQTAPIKKIQQVNPRTQPLV